MRNRVKNPMSIVRVGQSLIAGAAGMYFFDPLQGKRRRVLLRDQMISKGKQLSCFLDVALRDLGHRCRGLVAQTRFRVQGRHVEDDILVRRVAAKLGRYVSHPSALGITANDGVVTLTGPILTHEVDRVVSATESVPGVKEVIDQMETHHSNDGISALQGGSRRIGRRSEVLQENWTPAVRLMASICGSYLLIRGLRRPGFVGLITGTSGAALLSRSIFNQNIRTIFGLTPSRQGIRLQKSITINLPAEEVYEFFSDFTRFPQFMRNVRDVRPGNEGRSHWTVAGPAGATVSWDAIVTLQEPNEVLAWKSETGSTVAHAGILRFETVHGNNTRVQVEMTYNPPAGILGHAVASLFGANPQKELNEDLLRAKSFLETGKPARDAAQHARTAAS